jgi:hypothetical protein
MDLGRDTRTWPGGRSRRGRRSVAWVAWLRRRPHVGEMGEADQVDEPDQVGAIGARRPRWPTATPVRPRGLAIPRNRRWHVGWTRKPGSQPWGRSQRRRQSGSFVVRRSRWARWARWARRPRWPGPPRWARRPRWSSWSRSRPSGLAIPRNRRWHVDWTRKPGSQPWGRSQRRRQSGAFVVRRSRWARRPRWPGPPRWSRRPRRPSWNRSRPSAPSRGPWSTRARRGAGRCRGWGARQGDWRRGRARAR